MLRWWTAVMNMLHPRGRERAARANGGHRRRREDEALLFLRKSGESKPLKIYIFKQSSEGYQTAAVLEESGASIERVDYQDMNGDGVLELIVGCRIMTGDSGIGPNRGNFE